MSVYRQMGEERRTPQRSSAGMRCGGVRCAAHGGTLLSDATVIQSSTVSPSGSNESSAVQPTRHTVSTSCGRLGDGLGYGDSERVLCRALFKRLERRTLTD